VPKNLVQRRIPAAIVVGRKHSRWILADDLLQDHSGDGGRQDAIREREERERTRHVSDERPWTEIRVDVLERSGQRL